MDKKLIFLVFVFLLVFSLFTGALFLSQNERSVRASKRTPAPFIHSICLSGALEMPVGGNVEITCVSRDINNDKVVGSQCAFTVLSGTGTVNPTNGTSDEDGMVKTQLSSQVAGVVEVQCLINDSIDAGKVSVQFTQ